MEFEFSSYLKPYVTETILRNFATRLSSAQLEQAIIKAYSGEQIEACPPRYQALLTSSIAFQLSSALARVLGPEVDSLVMPEGIASGVVKQIACTSAPEEPLFVVSSGTHGHINGVPSVYFMRTFLDTLLYYSADIPYPAEKALSPSGSPSGSPPGDSVPKLSFSEEHQRYFMERAGREHQPDVRNFLSRVNKQEELSSEQLLMLMSLMVDPDIEQEAFFLGLYSRHNVPWYFRRFLQDSEKYSQSLTEHLGGEFSTLEIDFAELDLLERAETMPIVSALRLSLSAILSRRKTISDAFLKRRPERIVLHALTMVRAFYGYYNHPSARGFSQLPDSRLHTLGIFTRLLRDSVSDILRMLSFEHSR